MIPPCDREALGESQFQRKKRWMVSCQLKSYFATSTTIDISLEVCSSLGKQNNMWFTSSFTKALSKSPSGRLVFISTVFQRLRQVIELP